MASGLAKYDPDRILASLRRRRKRATLAWRGLEENGFVQTLIVAALQFLNVRRQVRFRVMGEQLTLRTSTTDLQTARHSLGGEFGEALDHVTAPAGLIVDAGGYIGTAAIAFARHHPKARIVCLEPMPENYALCVANTCALPNIEVWNKALASRCASLPLFGRATGLEGNTLVAGAPDRRGAAPLAVVETLDIPTLLETCGASSIAFLKVDIEGAEKELFTHAAPWIERVDVVFAELHDRILAGCTAAFQTANSGRQIRNLGGEKQLSVRPQPTVTEAAAPA